MTYGSLCTGIGGFDLGFDRANMTPLFQCEIDKRAQSVLRRHWPGVLLLDDIRKAGKKTCPRVDVICAGTPCQDLSVAGKRGGLAGERSGLFFEFIRIVRELRPTFVVWENVPGAFSSNAGRDFAAVLRAVAECGARDIAWRVYDSQYRGLAQRRERVFLVADFGGERAGQILFEPACGCRNPPPSREAGQGVAATLRGRTESSGKGGYAGRGGEDDQNIVTVPSLTASGRGTARASESRGQDPLIVAPATSLCLSAKAGKRDDAESETFIVHTLRAEGHDASEDGTERGTPLVPVMASGAENANGCGIGVAGGPMFTLDTTGAAAVGPVAYACQGGAVGEFGTLRAGNGSMTGGIPFIVDQPIAFSNRLGQTDDVTETLRAASHGATPMVGQVAGTLGANHGNIKAEHAWTGQLQQSPMGVRSLMPIECERLQGFPDGWTEFDDQGKPIADGPRYKMLGNAVSVPVAECIGRRLMEAIA